MSVVPDNTVAAWYLYDKNSSGYHVLCIEPNGYDSYEV
jgi:hypothetical protein